MASINKYPTVDVLQGGDLFVVWSTSNSDTRKTSLSAMLTYMNANITFPSAGKPAYSTQYAVPSATGFNVPIDDNSANDDLSENVWLVLTPTAGYADGTITLPIVTSVIDKQEVLVNCTQLVTTLVVDGNGATAVTGAPNSLGADDFFKMKFDIISKTWYRVG